MIVFVYTGPGSYQVNNCLQGYLIIKTFSTEYTTYCKYTSNYTNNLKVIPKKDFLGKAKQSKVKQSKAKKKKRERKKKKK